jgi:hypothetical protein
MMEGMILLRAFLIPAVVAVLCVVAWAVSVQAGQEEESRDDGKKSEEVRVYTNEDLPPPSDETRRPATGRDGTGETGKGAAPLTYSGYRDREGRGEAWWRSRVADLEREIRHAESDRDWAYRWQAHRGGLGAIPDDRRRYLDAEAKVKRLKAQRAVLREEARTAGALPGWLRELGPDETPKDRSSLAGSQILLAPDLLSPDDGATFDHFPRHTVLAWRTVPGAVTYEAEVQCLHCCGRGRWCPDERAQDLTSPQFSFRFTGAQPGRWRVRAVTDKGVAGHWSEWREFEYLR